MGYTINKDNIQKYARERVTYGYVIRDKQLKYYYEFTITFNQAYWSKSQVWSYGVSNSIEDIVKPLIRCGITANINYSIEYHKNGYPHVHGHVITLEEIDPGIQHQIVARACRRYGRTQWYQTGEEDMYHEVSEMKWSEYIKKDIETNKELNNGLEHYYELKIN